jgi:hypothetical protein
MNNEEFFYIAVQKPLKGRKGEREKGNFCASERRAKLA